MNAGPPQRPFATRLTVQARAWWTPVRQATSRLAAAAGQLARLAAFRRLLLGLPALGVALGGLLSLPLLRTDATQIQRRYEEAASQAQARNDQATVRVCLDRLMALKQQTRSTSAETTERLARLALDLGQIERADVLLAEIAPEDRPGSAPAHLLRAMLLLRAPGEGRGIPRADRLRAERHLRSALEREAEMPEAHELLARIALQDGDTASAEAHMERAARANPTNPALSYQVAAIMERRGRSETAAFWARQARDRFARISTERPDDHAARLGWVAAEVLLRNYEAARSVLKRGLDRANLADYHRTLAGVYLAEAADLSRRGDPRPGERWALLEAALDQDPSNPALIEQVSVVLKASGAEAEQARQQLRALLARGQAPATAHLLLGYDAWEQGHQDEARVHWERALEAGPNSAVVANNLAWALATGPNPDLPRALSLVDGVLALRPGEPSLLGTRGRILVRQGRWKEALAALEAALPSQPENRDLHADLAEVYAALKSPEMAAHHRRLAEAPTTRPTPR